MADGPEGGERLESWKDIAAYLRRDVRTVQRWEQTDGLPIHRLKRAQRAIPYAYTAELDAWWASRSVISPTSNTGTRGGTNAPDTPVPPLGPPRSRGRLIIGSGALLLLVLSAGAYWMPRAGSSQGSTTTSPGTGTRSQQSQKSLAVLPFVDLSEGMKNEEFADGLTEELIDRLNKIPDFRVPAPTSSFYFKNKHVPLADIARTLRVAYVLDGSVRKSGDRLRVAARLIRIDDARIVWSETYDRSWGDILNVQDDIAGEVTKALRSSIESGNPAN